MCLHIHICCIFVHFCRFALINAGLYYCLMDVLLNLSEKERRMKKLFSLVLIVLCMFTVSYAQNMNFYDNSQIGSLVVNALCQDEDGFIWLGTKDGLRRFDGTQFILYYHNRQDTTSLADNEVTSLLIDKNQCLWVGTVNGLQFYQSESDSFRSVSLSGVDINKGHILNILQLDNGELLCVVANLGIFSIDRQTMVAHPILIDGYGFNLRNLSILFEDSRKRLWGGTNGEGIVRINLDTKEYQTCTPATSVVRSFIEDCDGRILTVTSQALYLWNEKNNEFSPLLYYGKKKDIVYRSAILTNEGDILIGTSGQGLLFVKRGSDKVVDTELFDNSFIDINRAKVNILYEDKFQNMWIGCLYQGVLVRPCYTMPFLFTQSPANLSGIPGWINALYCDSRNNLWCTVEGNGIYQLDNKGNILRNFKINETVFSIFEDSQGSYWAGIDKKGLYLINPNTGALKPVYPLQGFFNIRCIIEDKNRKVYAAVSGKGLLCYNLITGETQWLRLEKDDNGEALANDWVISVYCDSDNRLWLGYFGGVSCYDTSSKRFIELPFPKEIKSSSFYAFVETEDHIIWMATRTGVIAYNPKTGQYSIMTMEQGLSNDFVCGIVKDTQGNLWCNTIRGISCINRKTHKVNNYFVDNALQESVFLEGRYTQGRDGRIYFGGGKGITSFNPDDIRQLKLEHAPCITDMYIFDRRVNQKSFSGGGPVIQRRVLHATDFHLAYFDNTFTFMVSMMGNNIGVRNILYEYRLREFGDSWNQTLPGENRIQFHHLSPGEYTLDIRACDNGIFSPVKSVRIHISPPWFFSNYAKLIYFLIFIMACYLIYVAVQRKRKERTVEMKLRFFINIAHEIRSPLTLIVSPLERLLKKDNDNDTTKLLQTIRYNTNRILNLLNQLLDIRRIDKGQMNLRFSKTDLQWFIRELLNIFLEQAQQKDISLDVRFAENLPMIWIDRNNFDKVLVNLLTNALKYTPKGGNIQISVITGTNVRTVGPLRDYVEISVSDTGNGLNEKELKRVFERFYQGDANRKVAPIGFGIGLNLCQSLVNLHHGVIFAENRKDTQGSRFVVRLPLGCSHLRKEEFDDSYSDMPVRKYLVEEQVISADEKLAKSRTRYRVLVIDDDEVLLHFLQDSLSVSYRVDTAADGMEGWQKAVTTLPDLIVADILMPGMDGIQLLKELKKNPNTNHIPIILLTSKTELASRIEGLEGGADGYLNKPFSLEELNTLINNLITNRIRLRGKFSGKQTQEGKMTPIELQSNDEMLMNRVMKVIDSNISNTMLSVEFLAQEVGLSRSQLHRRLKDMTGVSVSDFIRNTRLRQAADLLKKENMSVSQIAYAVGFTSQSHFSTMFKKLYGMTPTEYMEAVLEGKQKIDQKVLEGKC